MEKEFTIQFVQHFSTINWYFWQNITLTYQQFKEESVKGVKKKIMWVLVESVRK